MYLWDPSTGALYLWEGLHFDSSTSALTCTQFVIADGLSTRWNLGAALTLQAADFSGNGVPGLWAVTGSGADHGYRPLNRALCGAQRHQSRTRPAPPGPFAGNPRVPAS